MISLKFIPLTFITSNDEIIRQIKNTVVFSHLFETCNETTFNSYIETTQYGFTASARENGSHKMLRITDIHHSKVNWESVPFCDCSDDDKYLLKDNDILVARTGGTTGKSFFVENPPSNAVFASYLIRIRLKKAVSIEFINAFLNSYCFWSQIVEMKAGSAQPNVNAEKLKTLSIPECDLETQEKTVRLIKEENSSDSIRERIDEIENVFWSSSQISTELNQQLNLVKELRQAYLREAMQGKLVPQDERDEPAEILLEKIKAEKEKLVREKRIKKDKPLPPINADEIPFEIPESWTWCRLGEIVEFSDNLNIHSKFSDETLINYVDIDAIDNKRFEIREVKEKPVVQLSSRARRILRKGFIVYSLVRPYLNNIAIVEDEKENYIGSTGFVVFNGILVENKLLKFVLLSQYVRKLYLDYLSGFNSPSITNEQFQATIIPLPPLSEQERIVARLEKLMKFCDELEANIRDGIADAERLLQTALKEALEPKQAS